MLLARLTFALTQPRTAWRHFLQTRAGFIVDAHGFKRRAYSSYDHYLREQAEKLATKGDGWIAEYEQRYEASLRQRLEAADVVSVGLPVLCLAARLGAEVRAFRSLGAFAIGIDLNPGNENECVCYGDFHRLAYADQSVGIVFTNALDHAFDFSALTSEIRRVLRPEGLFITETVIGNTTGTPYGYYDAIGWSSVDAVNQAIEAGGFTMVTQAPTDYPGGRIWTVFRVQ